MKCNKPNKCIIKAQEILESIDPKWNPTKNPKEDFFTRPEPEKTGPIENPETEEKVIVFNPYSVQKTLTECIQIFTEPEGNQPETII